jgi:ABC-type glycerol-3-phosphate transport system permease component
MHMMTSGGVPFSRYLFNSLLSSVMIVVATLYISLNAAYVLSKKRFRGKNALFALNTAALMFVPAAVKIPRYLLVQQAGLLNTFLALVLPMLAMPVGLFLIKQNIDQVPDSLIEAARIDGAKEFRVLYQIVAPIIRPALVTVAILAFQSAWNNAEYSQLYINDDSIKTFAFYMSSLTSAVGNTIAGQGMAAAGSLILFLPNLIIFILMQSKVVNTMANSGIK